MAKFPEETIRFTDVKFGKLVSLLRRGPIRTAFSDINSQEKRELQKIKRGISYQSPGRYCESSGRDASGGFRFRIERSKIDNNCAIILRITIGPAENHDMTAHIMTGTHPCLIVVRSSSRSYTCEVVLQAFTRPVLSKSVKDDSIDHFTFFHLSKDQVLD
ncbi:hypothetical protein TNCV_4639031 [Trichonephila clavipes]|uniref:Uncharacterized protein n=1 Tax=Trichonephila clavipes TaxID=2585209 RepID=A0A8X6WD35_TRICX|nr:hypothetical protein TNCV_4639031 [Trichonephila clavipes]